MAELHPKNSNSYPIGLHLPIFKNHTNFYFTTVRTLQILFVKFFSNRDKHAHERSPQYATVRNRSQREHNIYAAILRILCTPSKYVKRKRSAVNTV